MECYCYGVGWMNYLVQTRQCRRGIRIYEMRRMPSCRVHTLPLIESVDAAQLLDSTVHFPLYLGSLEILAALL